MNYKDRWKLYDLIVNNRMISQAAKKEFLERWKRDEEEIKLQQKKKRRKQTVRKNIEKKRLNWYVTFTVNPEFKDRKDLKKLRQGLQQLLKYHEVDYYLIPEFHSDGVSYHFHGFIGCDRMDLFEDSGRKDKFRNKIYNFIPYSRNYGFSACVLLDGKSERQKNRIINYVVMYMVKDNLKAMSSRKNFAGKRLAERLRALLGDDIVQVV